MSWVNGVRLQQYLPFTVLKRSANGREINLDLSKLQQYLPFTVLKHTATCFWNRLKRNNVATVLTVYGIETILFISTTFLACMVATVLTVYGIETRIIIQ